MVECEGVKKKKRQKKRIKFFLTEECQAINVEKIVELDSQHFVSPKL